MDNLHFILIQIIQIIKIYRNGNEQQNISTQILSYITHGYIRNTVMFNINYRFDYILKQIKTDITLLLEGIRESLMYIVN